MKRKLHQQHSKVNSYEYHMKDKILKSPEVVSRLLIDLQPGDN